MNSYWWNLFLNMLVAQNNEIHNKTNIRKMSTVFVCVRCVRSYLNGVCDCLRCTNTKWRSNCYAYIHTEIQLHRWIVELSLTYQRTDKWTHTHRHECRTAQKMFAIVHNILIQYSYEHRSSNTLNWIYLTM